MVRKVHVLSLLIELVHNPDDPVIRAATIVLRNLSVDPCNKSFAGECSCMYVCNTMCFLLLLTVHSASLPYLTFLPADIHPSLFFPPCYSSTILYLFVLPLHLFPLYTLVATIG